MAASTRLSPESSGWRRCYGVTTTSDVNASPNGNGVWPLNWNSRPLNYIWSSISRHSANKQWPRGWSRFIDIFQCQATAPLDTPLYGMDPRELSHTESFQDYASMCSCYCFAMLDNMQGVDDQIVRYNIS